MTALDTLPKILIWDLETTHLKGNMGWILCLSYKWAESDDVFYWRIDKEPGFGTSPKSFKNDKAGVEIMCDMLAEADAQCTHYGTRFDLRFLKTRCLAHGIPVPPPVRMIDTWRYSRDNLALTSNRLETLSNFLKTDQVKYKLPLELWAEAQFGDKKILDAMTKYCINDVETLEKVYLKMRPLINDHPHCGLGAGKCPACGSFKIHRKGHRRTKLFFIERLHCQNCGTWSDGAKKKI